SRRVRVLGEQPEGERLERVTGEDRGGVTEDGPRGGPVTAGGVTVHHVVVQQREVVDQFHRRRGPDGGRPRTGAAEGRGPGEHQCGTDRLAGTAGGRSAVRVLPAEVVARDAAHRAGQGADRGPQHRVDLRPGTLQ